MAHSIITLTLLLSFLSPSFRVTAVPRVAVRPPDELHISLYLTGNEDAFVISLYDSDGFLLRSSGEELHGERHKRITWKRLPSGDLTLVAIAITDDKVARETLDLHYLGW